MSVNKTAVWRQVSWWWWRRRGEGRGLCYWSTLLAWLAASIKIMHWCAPVSNPILGELGLEDDGNKMQACPTRIQTSNQLPTSSTFSAFQGVFLSLTFVSFSLPSIDFSSLSTSKPPTCLHPDLRHRNLLSHFLSWKHFRAREASMDAGSGVLGEQWTSLAK